MMSGSWQGSDRRSTLPPDWPTIRPTILERDHHQCTWIVGLDDGGPERYLFTGDYNPHHRCPEPGPEVDHIGDPADHQPHNLRTLCTTHHAHRSSHQGNTARAALRAQLTPPPEPHPGLR